MNVLVSNPGGNSLKVEAHLLLAGAAVRFRGQQGDK
jgi:hypothetical protein